MTTARPGPGRPKKYGREARSVAVTLPEDVVASLLAINADLGRAIVEIVEHRRTRGPHTVRPADLVSYGNHAVIVVTPLKALKRLPGVQLVPIGNGRALIALDHPQLIPQLELNIRDALDKVAVKAVERGALEALAEILKSARLSDSVSIEERTIIVLQARRQRRASRQKR